ncbi:MAG: bifunctional nuclease domain-containing protein [Aquisalimonadaceae bacterium]
MAMRSILRALCALILLLAVIQAQARELAVERDSLVPVELATVGINPLAGTPVVLLREPQSGDILPIAIGLLEAQSIFRALQGIEELRPQTHDLIGHLLSATGARLEQVIVDELRGGTYLGILELRVPDQDQTLLVDSRPSDALALAARSPGVTILVAPEILVSTRDLDYEGLRDQVVTAMGITVVDATRELRTALGLPGNDGVLVSGVSGRAASLGLEVGSLILEINGDAPASPMDFLDKVRATPSGAAATITYWQAGGEHSMELDTGVPIVENPDAPRIRL